MCCADAPIQPQLGTATDQGEQDKRESEGFDLVGPKQQVNKYDK
jgi:hypothetical protein